MEELDIVGDDEEEKKDSNSKGFTKVKLEDVLIEVTPDNISKFTINDVVMPLVGYKTRMPANEELKELILGIMAEDSITVENYQR